MTPTSSGIEFWAGLTAAIYLVAMAMGLVTRTINPSQKAGSAWRYEYGRITFDISPWTLDVPLRYRPASVVEVLDGWSDKGRRLAAWLHLTLDVAFPLAYALTLWMAISLVAYHLKLNPTVTALLVGLPFATAFADWLENGIIVWLSRHYGQARLAVATTLWVDSVVKWVLLTTSIGVLFLLWVATQMRVAA